MRFNRLLLVTQLHRSGGTLFSQLLDGHSSIQAHPHELFIGKPNKWDWPRLAASLDDPNKIFSLLSEEKIADLGRLKNFVKPGRNQAARQQIVPFSYDVSHHQRLFIDIYQRAFVKTQRFAIQLYLATFFKAWPEYRASDREVYVSCFLPHILLHDDSMRRLFEDFPDLLLVNILRRPDSWLASLENHIQLDLNDACVVRQNLDRWKASVHKIVSLHKNPSIDSFSTSYEQLVQSSEAELKRFCSAAGLIYEPILAFPTVGGFPVMPNSSYNNATTGINRSSLGAASRLPFEIQELISQDYAPIYESACLELGIPDIPQKLSDKHSAKSQLNIIAQGHQSLDLPNLLSPRPVDSSLVKFCRQKLSSATTRSSPFPYLYLDKLFPNALMQAINNHYPTVEQMAPMPAQRTGNLYAHKHRRMLSLNDEALEAFDRPFIDFWVQFYRLIESISEPLLMALPQPSDDQKSAKVDYSAVRPRVDLWSDQGGYQIAPHTDAPHKIATFLLYCTDDPALTDEGTSVFVPKREGFRCWAGRQWEMDDFIEVYRAPYGPNHLFGFRKTDASFHGKLPVEESIIARRTIAITLQLADDFVK